MGLKRSSEIFFALALQSFATLVVLTLIGVLPSYTCVVNANGTFCTIHYLRGDEIISCSVPPFLCIGTHVWENPLILPVEFWTIDVGILGFVLVFWQFETRRAREQGNRGLGASALHKT